MDNTTKTYQLFQNGQSYKNSLELNLQITRCVNFLEGRQWTNEEGTEDYPKIVLNYLKQISKVRQSGILQNNYSFLVNTLKFEDAKKIQYFMKYLYKKCKIRRKNLIVLNDDFKKGTSGLYFYWDSNSRSLMSKDMGELKAEIFDIRNLVVADPGILDIQDQEWIIYTVREKVGALRKQYPEKAEDIHSDGYNELSKTQKEQIGIDEEEEYCSIFIKYFRNEDGQVCYTISTETVELQDTEFLNPFYDGPKEEQPNTLSINDNIAQDKDYGDSIFGLYPFAVISTEKRDNCFYGIPGAYEYIEAQKSINAHFATYDFAIEDNVLGGFVMKKGILGDQEISTESGQILELELKPGDKIGDVFGRIPTNPVPNDSANYSAMLTGALKQVSGATNVQLGQADYSNQTAKATQMLLDRAKENSSDFAITFEEYMTDVANIMFMFAKFYYDKKEFNIIEHGNLTDTNQDYTGNKAFKGSEYVMDDINFDIKVTPSESFNESVLQQLAMMCVQTGNLDMKSVLAMLPYDTFPSFQELKKSLDEYDQTKDYIKQLEQKLDQASQVMQQMSIEYNKMKEKNKTMDTLVQENLRLKEQMADVYVKSIETTKKANDELFDLKNIILNNFTKKENK